MFESALLLPDRIIVKNLERNSGIIPLTPVALRVKPPFDGLRCYYDLNLVIEIISKLQQKNSEPLHHTPKLRKKAKFLLR